MKYKIDTYYIVIKSLRKDIIEGDSLIIKENKHDPSLGAYIIQLSAGEPGDICTGSQRQDCKYFKNEKEVDMFLQDIQNIEVVYNLGLAYKFINKKLEEIKYLRDNHEIKDTEISCEKLQLEKRISYLQGALKYSVWADNIPDGKLIYDDMQRELNSLLVYELKK